MTIHLQPGGHIDLSRRKLDLSDPQQLEAWLKVNGCPTELRSRIVKGEFRAAVERYTTRNAPVPVVASNAVPTIAELRDELKRCNAKLLNESLDRQLRERCAELGAEIRRDSEVDDEEPEEGDDDFEAFSFDNCTKCGSDDLDISFNSDTDRIESRCIRCSFRASRPALNNEEVSAARQHHDTRAGWRGQRGY